MVLAGACIVAGTAWTQVIRLDPSAAHRSTPAASADPQPPTAHPVPALSVRRVPSVLTAARRDRTRVSAAEPLLDAYGSDVCAVVRSGALERDHRGHEPMAPASTQKLAVAVAAIAHFGPDHRFETVLAATTAPEDGVLHGDLYVVGGGDPVLATEPFASRFSAPEAFTDVGELVDVVTSAGVTRIEGRLVGDESRHDTMRHHPAWPARYASIGFVGPASALRVDNGYRSWSATGRTTGVPVTDPATFATTTIADALGEAGVAVVGGSAVGTVPPDAAELGRVHSATLADIVGHLLSESDNGAAEMLVKELGVSVAGEGSYAAGMRAIEAILPEAGLDLSGSVLVDGSGLAPGSRMSCRLVADLLDHPALAPHLAASLAVVGESGTLADRWTDTELAGRVRGKTGTLIGVYALAGIVGGDGSAPSRFVLIRNGGTETRALAEQRELLEALVAAEDPDVHTRLVELLERGPA